MMLIGKFKSRIGSWGFIALLMANFTVLAPTETKAVVAASSIECSCSFLGLWNKLCLADNMGKTCRENSIN